MINTIKQILNKAGYENNRSWKINLNSGILENNKDGLSFKKNSETSFKKLETHMWETIADVFNDVKQQVS